MAKAIMVVGTTSDAGKSLLCAALCRHFSKKGYNTVPFKTLNVSLNAYSTRDGGEIGMSQAFQAWAAGQEPSVHMNPILVKPHGNGVCHYVVAGKPYKCDGSVKEARCDIWEQAKGCYRELDSTADIIVCEGSGSPAEINLRDYDIANMKTAQFANAPTLLVGDIDAGGVFAGIYGTYALVDEQYRDLFSGYIINKFRGDASILTAGTQRITTLTGLPCLGIVPYVSLSFPAEDSMSLGTHYCHAAKTDDIRTSWMQNLDVFLGTLGECADMDAIESIVLGGRDGL